MAHVCTMIPVARASGSRWIVEGHGVLHPLGRGDGSTDEDEAVRLRTVRSAIDVLSRAPEGVSGS